MSSTPTAEQILKDEQFIKAIQSMVYYSQIHEVKNVRPAGLMLHEEAWRYAQKILWDSFKRIEDSYVFTPEQPSSVGGMNWVKASDRAIGVCPTPSFLEGELHINEGHLYSSPLSVRIPLPEGNWTILGRGNELTGGEMLGLIEKENDGSGHLNSWWYKNYMTGDFTKDFRESFASLLKSKNLNPDTTLILIKQP